MTIEYFNTEGVLLITSSNALKRYYVDRPFNYDFPNGLFDLIREGKLFAIITQETLSELTIHFELASEEELQGFDFMNDNNYFEVEPNDVILMPDHGYFTRLCDWEKGHYERHDEEIPPVLDIAVGAYKILTYHKYVQSELPYIKLIFQKVDAIDASKQVLSPIEIF
jgi:hypothetical protein